MTTQWHPLRGVYCGPSNRFIAIPGLTLRDAPGIENRFGHEVPDMDSRANGNGGPADPSGNHETALVASLYLGLRQA